MTRNALRFATQAIVSTALCFALVGCGGSTPSAETANPASLSNVVGAGAAQPTDTVSQFLDQIRRGGDDSGAGTLLTQRAQAELKRIGRSLEPIGSPDASFNVTRGEEVPNDPESMLVHSVWTEPNGDGTKSDYQVVWALQRENSVWKISGLAMEFEPGQDPAIINFEDGNSMQQILGDVEVATTPSDNSSQATLPSDTTRR